MRRPGRWATALLLGATGCLRSDDVDRVDWSTTGTSQSPTAGEDEDDHDHAEQTTAPAVEQDEVQAARRFLVTWSRPDPAYNQWCADLEPLLSPQGQQDYSYTNPANVPALELTGQPRGGEVDGGHGDRSSSTVREVRPGTGTRHKSCG